MLAALGLLALGGALLYAGAEGATRGAASLARTLGVPIFVVGALLFGVDLEGLGTAIGASANGEPALAAGSIFGTVLFLFGAAFGSALLISKRPIPSPSASMVLAPAIPLVASALAIADRYVDRLEGALLVTLYVGYVALVVREGRLVKIRSEELERETVPRSRLTLIAWTVGGLALLASGAAVAVAGATRFVTEVGLSKGFVGAAILGIVVSLDEILLEVLPARRGDPELATGNLMGTLAAFCSGVLGVAAIVRPLDIDSASAVAFLGAAFLYAVVATVFLVRHRAGWGLGLVLLGSYGMWLVTASDL